jgi:hypothetical protein
MSDPLDAFLSHAQQLPAYSELNLSEADTRVYLIDPVLRVLGYVGVGDIRREVAVPATKEFLDYEIYADGKAQAIVEAKAIRIQVSDAAAAQCVQYAAVLGVRWCIITNGITWAIYNAHAGGPLADKRVATVRLDGDEQAVLDTWEVLSLFSKESLARANPLTRLLAERVILDELYRPDSAAVTALRKAVKDRFGERVTPQTVIDSIDKLRGRSTRSDLVTPPTPVGPAAVATPISTELAPDSDGRERRRQEILKPDGSRVSLKDLLDGGVIPSDAALQSKGKGVSFVARLRESGVEMSGTLYANLSEAATAAAGSTRNGWDYWMYQGVRLGDLRKQFAERLATEASRGTA